MLAKSANIMYERAPRRGARWPARGTTILGEYTTHSASSTDSRMRVNRGPVSSLYTHPFSFERIEIVRS